MWFVKLSNTGCRSRVHLVLRSVLLVHWILVEIIALILLLRLVESSLTELLGSLGLVLKLSWWTLLKLRRRLPLLRNAHRWSSWGCSWWRLSLRCCKRSFYLWPSLWWLSKLRWLWCWSQTLPLTKLWISSKARISLIEIWAHWRCWIRSWRIHDIRISKWFWLQSWIILLKWPLSILASKLLLVIWTRSNTNTRT